MAGSLRDRMPVAAWLIDQLRKQWGVEQTDALVRRAMRGQAGQEGALYLAELNEAGELLEFGCTRDGRRVVVGEGGLLAWVDAQGSPIAPPAPPVECPMGAVHSSVTGPPARGRARVIRASVPAQPQGNPKGVVP
jgi:hypothetical protein